MHTDHRNDTNPLSNWNPPLIFLRSNVDIEYKPMQVIFATTNKAKIHIVEAGAFLSCLTLASKEKIYKTVAYLQNRNRGIDYRAIYTI